MKNKTVGVSPKLVAGVVGAIVSYLLAQTVLDLPPVAVLALNAVGVAIAAAAAGPGLVTADRPPRDGEAGYGLVELAVALLIFAVAIVVILRIV